MYPHRREIEGDFIPRTEGVRVMGPWSLRLEWGSTRHGVLTASSRWRKQELTLIDPQRKCGLADRPLSSDPRTLSLDSRPPGTARINFIYFPTRTHCGLSLVLVSFTHPGLIFCPLSTLLTSVSDHPGQQQREKRRGRESWSLRDTIRSWHFCPQVRQVF